MARRAIVFDDRYDARIRLNARRLKSGWAEYLAMFDWEKFITLTTDPKKFRNPSQDALSREVHRFCNDLSRLSRFPVGWAYAVEGGGGRSLHAHVLTMREGTQARRAAMLGWQARNGRTHRRDVDDIAEAVRYLCKSIGPRGEISFSDSLATFPRTVRERSCEEIATVPGVLS